MSNIEQAFSQVQRIVFERSGMHVSEKKLYLVETRLSSFCRDEHCKDIGELMTKLGPYPNEEQTRRIVEAMTTNETWWFRDQDIYNALNDHLWPELVRRKLLKNEKEILLWSAACSTGQEVYSLKLAWQKFEPKARGIKLRIVATDIDTKVLEQAKAGIYTQLEVGRGLPTMDLMMNFEQDGAKWKVGEKLKDGIEWKQANLVEASPLIGQADITLCRNVLIYFDDDHKRKILGNIKRALRPEGVLFIGGSESIFTLETDYKRISIGRVFAYGHEGAEKMVEEMKVNDPKLSAG